MYKQLIFVTSILLAFGEVSATEVSDSNFTGKFAEVNNLVEGKLSRNWLEKTSAVKNELAISTCCFGCPDPLKVVHLSNNFYLMANREIRLVTKKT